MHKYLAVQKTALRTLLRQICKVMVTPIMQNCKSMKNICVFSLFASSINQCEGVYEHIVVK